MKYCATVDAANRFNPFNLISTSPPKLKRDLAEGAAEHNPLNIYRMMVVGKCPLVAPG